MKSVLRSVLGSLFLAAVFFIIVTPLGLLMRAVGRDPLKLRRDRSAKSFWIDRRPPGPAPESLKNQV